MKPNQLKYGSVEHIRVRLDGSSPSLQLSKGDEVDLRWSEEARAYLLRGTKGVARVEPASRADEDTLHEICVRNLTRVVWVADIQNKEVLLQAHTFQLELRLELQIGVEEQAVDKARRNINRRIKTSKELVDWLTEQCLLPPIASREVRAFLSAGKELSEETPEAFVLHGHSVRVHVKREPTPTGEGEMFVVDRITRSGKASPRYPIAHVEGNIQFTDTTVAAWARGEGVSELQQLVDDGTSFLELWKKYGELEENSILNAARAVGSVVYQGREQLPNGDFCFYVDGASKDKLARLEANDSMEMEAAEEVPELLRDSFLTWKEFEESQHGQHRTGASFRGEIIGSPHVGRGEIVLRSDDDHPPPKGFLFPSIQGDRRRLERRRNAQERISSLQCSLPIAHLLIGARVPVPRPKKLPALTPKVREKIFRDHPPTLPQERAIRVALNTPDIAVIQGPPGTGKTKVIEAIVERLNEELDTFGAGAGQILVTGFQHDAVENALNRIDVNGLPAIKFGQRKGRDELGESERRIDQWVQERAENIEQKMPETARSDLQRLQRWLASARESYVLSPGLPLSTVRLLRQVVEQACGEVSSHLLDRISDLANEIERREVSRGERNPEITTLERTVRALRVDPVSFTDDGPLNAQRLLTRLERQAHVKVPAEVRSMLKRAAGWVQPKPPDFLGDLAQARQALLLELVPDRSSDLSAAITHQDVTALLSEACAELEQRYRTSRNAPDAVVADYLHQLENNPHSVRRAVIDYNSVFGATCQQAASQFIANIKPNLEYDTVLIDEAARSTPLDLFIPMAQARRRIILVGDHRQLSHIIDRQLQREIENDVTRDKSIAEETKDSIEESLFKYLFENLGPESGTETRRVVTLDTQFRMHPVLGDFVSKEFYESEDEQHIKIKAGLSAKHFSHALPKYKDRVAAWYDVSPKLGRERPGQSKSRPSEAKALAEELKRMLDAPAAKDLTFGCITFYSAQVKCINDELRRLGVVDGNDEVLPEYRDLYLSDGQIVERLRIGTVDAFQGKEFDVVLLSVVRSNNQRDHDERVQRRRYGHLMSPNRLCVSMSRQKRLLIVFGDPTLLEASNAGSAIGPLVRFRQELCRGEYGCIV